MHSVYELNLDMIPVKTVVNIENSIMISILIQSLVKKQKNIIFWNLSIIYKKNKSQKSLELAYKLLIHPA